MTQEGFRSFQIHASFAILSSVDGCFLVFIGWGIANLSTTVGAVGLALLSGHISTLFASRFVGRKIDLGASGLLHGAGFLLCGLAALIATSASLGVFGEALPVFVISCCIYSLGRVMTLVSLEVLQQWSTLQSRDTARATASMTFVKQSFLLIGTSLGGLLIHKVDISGCGFALVLASLVGAASCYDLKRPVASPVEDTLSQNGEGVILYIWRSPSLATLIVIGAMSFSVAQLINAALPYVVLFVLKGDSIVLSLLEAAWAIGGISTAAVISFGVGRSPTPLALPPVLLFFAVLSSASYFVMHLAASALLYFFMGLSFSLLRIGCDSEVFKSCRVGSIARVRMLNQQVISAFGILIYSAPSFFQVEAYKLLPIWGIIIGLISLVTICASFLRRR